MRRSLRPGIIATVSTVSLAACNRPTPEPKHWNPPAITTHSATAGDPLATSAPPPPPPPPRAVKVRQATGSVDWASYSVALNPHDAEGRVIHRVAASCYVELPFDKPPTSVIPHPTKEVACPKEMLQPEWAACSGELRAKADKSECLCAMFGNPPPPPLLMDCPK